MAINGGHFERGQKTGAEMEYVSIAVNNVWGGLTKSGGHVASYEKLGYHTGSLEFIRGVFAVGCRVVKYSWQEGKVVEAEVGSFDELLPLLAG